LAALLTNRERSGGRTSAYQWTRARSAHAPVFVAGSAKHFPRKRA
jgi:hypothetical protein